MKIAFVGKGGSGKTTLSALFCRMLALQGCPVVAFDADINQHLGCALGLAEAEVAAIPALGADQERIKAYLRGTNTRISSVATMVKTTPPGRGSRLWTVKERNPLFAHFAREVEGVRLLVTGAFEEEDLGIKCYHSKVGAVELLLNHYSNCEHEYVVVDMTAGADAFASGLFMLFDLTVLVVEPTRASLSVYAQYKRYAQDYPVQIRVIGNKIEDEDDRAFVQESVGDDWLVGLLRSAYVHAAEKGRVSPFTALEAENVQALALLKTTLDGCPLDQERSYRYLLEMHRKNALSWANAAVGADLVQQIDPEYCPSTWDAVASHSQL